MIKTYWLTTKFSVLTFIFSHNQSHYICQFYPISYQFHTTTYPPQARPFIVSLTRVKVHFFLKKGAKKDCSTKFPENLPMSKCKQNMVFRSVKLFHRRYKINRNSEYWIWAMFCLRFDMDNFSGNFVEQSFSIPFFQKKSYLNLITWTFLDKSHV